MKDVTIRVDGKGPRCVKGEERVSIRYYAIPNNDKHSGGWLPQFRVDRGNGKNHSYARGMDKDAALAAAKRDALEYAEHKFSGDICVIVNKGRNVPDRYRKF